MRSTPFSRHIRKPFVSKAIALGSARGGGGGGMLALAFGFGVAALTAPASAEVIDFLITLDGGQENPPVDTPATGSGTATLDTETNDFRWNITFQDLTSDQTAAHFHAPADLCVNAGVVVPLENGSPIVGSTTVTDEQEQQIIDGLWYVNVHSVNFPSGEIRGQVELAPLDDPIPAPIEPGSVAVRFDRIANGMAAPNFGVAAPGIARRLFVTDQNGIIWNVNLDTGEQTVFADLSARLVELGAFGEGTYDERGLLGLAFHPNYQVNGLLYTYTSEPFDPNTPPDFSTMPEGVEPDHQSAIAEWQVTNPADPDPSIEPGSRRELMRIDQPQFNHNAGALLFGPDGMLYIALGDGGEADDQGVGHVCIGNAQATENILGNLLRIDPLGNNSANGQYGIPANNPFVNEPGLDEIFAFGFRNPFRFSFDALTGDLYLADVGQNDIEEVNIITSGGNYGWRIKEGDFPFVPNGIGPGYVTTPEFAEGGGGLIDPIAQYDHDEGLAVIGGFVYRGSRIDDLQGEYVFGDLEPAVEENTIGRLFYLDTNNVIRELQLEGYEAPERHLLGFGVDAEGEIYVLGNETETPFGTTGFVLRLAPEFNLTIEPGCPSDSLGFAAAGASPGDRVAFVRASSTGEIQIPPGRPCAGATLGLGNDARLVGVSTAGATGAAMIERNIPPGACGSFFIQAINLATCETTDVEPLR